MSWSRGGKRLARATIDAAVILACIAVILRVARRQTVDCTWGRFRATCVVEQEDSLGRVRRDAIEGVQAAAYRTGATVGLVTDARHIADLDLRSTREIELATEEEAAHLRAFADDRMPETFSAAAGVPHPRALTGALLAGLGVYAFVTRRRRGGT